MSALQHIVSGGQFFKVFLYCTVTRGHYGIKPNITDDYFLFLNDNIKSYIRTGVKKYTVLNKVKEEWKKKQLLKQVRLTLLDFTVLKIVIIRVSFISHHFTLLHFYFTFHLTLLKSTFFLNALHFTSLCFTVLFKMYLTQLLFT